MLSRLLLCPVTLLLPFFLWAPSIEGAATPAFGPPLLCHPFELDGATSLPFGKGPFDADPDLARSRVLPLAISLLAASDDTTVHMETVRRLVVTLGGDPHSSGDRRTALRPVIEALSERHQRAVSEMASHPLDARARRAVALTGLDLAYACGAAADFGATMRDDRETAALATTAVALCPDDGAVHLFAAMLAMSQARTEQMYRHLDSALVRAVDEDGMLCRNICGTLGRNLNLKTRKALVARVGQRVEHA